MLPFRYLAVLALVVETFAQNYEFHSDPRPAPQRIQTGFSGASGSAPRPTPVPILKQINRHNEDGSYTYGYEGADGSFKIETKLPTGEVKGKYGYVDDTGKVRTVEYGATKYGFEPAGEGITVAPPTLVDETTNKDGSQNPAFGGAYYDDAQQPQSQPIPVRAPITRPRPRPEPSFESFSAPQFAPSPPRSPAPIPARAVIPGSSPIGQSHSIDFGPRPAPSRSYAPVARPSPLSFDNPAPIEEYNEPAPVRSSPKITYAHPAPSPHFAPAPRPAPQYAPAPVARPSAPSRSGGILDQLSKDYALPQSGAAPLHDISFGYY